MVSEWYHDQHDVLIDQFMNIYNPTGAEPVPPSAIMYWSQNGAYATDAADIAKGIDVGDQMTIPFEAGKTYRLRFINAGAFAMFQLQLEGHEWCVSSSAILLPCPPADPRLPSLRRPTGRSSRPTVSTSSPTRSTTSRSRSPSATRSSSPPATTRRATTPCTPTLTRRCSTRSRTTCSSVSLRFLGPSREPSRSPPCSLPLLPRRLHRHDPVLGRCADRQRGDDPGLRVL